MIYSYYSMTTDIKRIYLEATFGHFVIFYKTITSGNRWNEQMMSVKQWLCRTSCNSHENLRNMSRLSHDRSFVKGIHWSVIASNADPWFSVNGNMNDLSNKQWLCPWSETQWLTNMWRNCNFRCKIQLASVSFMVVASRLRSYPIWHRYEWLR